MSDEHHTDLGLSPAADRRTRLFFLVAVLLLAAGGLAYYLTRPNYTEALHLEAAERDWKALMVKHRQENERLEAHRKAEMNKEREHWLKRIKEDPSQVEASQRALKELEEAHAKAKIWLKEIQQIEIDRFKDEDRAGVRIPDYAK